MSLFTNTQANACTIVRMEKRVRGSDTSWIVGVNDTDENYYDMELKSLGSDPSKSEIKTAVIAELGQIEKRSAKVVETITNVEDKGMDETLG